VLEVAFGGGEPMLFPRWSEFICELYETTQLCINFTTNGMLLTKEFLSSIAGKYGQIRVSLYDDNEWIHTITLLADHHARFGVNWLITPEELATMEMKFLQLLKLGVRDFLLLSYKGNDPRLHLTQTHRKQLSVFINRMYEQLGKMIQIKLDVCWGSSLPDIPRLFTHADCGAGDEFLSITSDKRVKVCSFQLTNTGIPFETVDELRQIWERQRMRRQAAKIGGCARLPNRGLSERSIDDAYIDLAAIQ
jgi:MoaA/NifB/PqqE/SkfB family radical SAM enzyme